MRFDTQPLFGAGTRARRTKHQHAPIAPAYDWREAGGPILGEANLLALKS
jgi:hypothetical protein